MDKTTLKNTSAVDLGTLGGQETKARYGARHFSEAGKKGMASRWRKVSCRRCGYRAHVTKILEHLQNCSSLIDKNP